MNSPSQPHAAAAAHTPTPWFQASSSHPAFSNSIGTKDRMVAKIHAWADTEGGLISLAESNANAAFIVRACNSHAALVSLLEELSAEDSQCRKDWLALKKQARAALALAKGTPSAAQAVKRFLDSKQPFAS